MSAPTEASWPPIRIELTPLGSVRILVAGVHVQTIPPSRAARRQAMDVAGDLARTYARPLHVDACDEEGTFHMTVHPDGHIDENAYTPAAKAQGA